MAELAWALVVALLVAPHSAFAGVCEQARIPLRTFDLGNGSQLCVVPFCGESEQKTAPKFPEQSAEGIFTCMKCNQEPWNMSAVDYHEKTDVCPTELGTCERGYCCPKKGSASWFNKNFGVDWKGMNTFPHITVTTYGGSTACGGDVSWAEQYVKPFGIDSIAAVPSQMYGSWISSMRAGSQSCYVNNNLCYEVTNWEDETFTLAIWGKCGGYTQCKGLDAAAGPPQDSYSKLVTSVADIFDANMCLNQKGVSIATGATPDCIVTHGEPGESPGGNYPCCAHTCQKHVDWCGSNDHFHLDIGESIFPLICKDRNPCTVKKAVPVLCPWNPPRNPAFADMEPRFTEPKMPGDPEVAPVHEPYPEPGCDEPGSPGDGGDGSLEGSLDCDSVTTANIPAMGSCAAGVCTLYCTKAMANGCASSSDAASCVQESVKADFCPVDGSCGCSFQAT